MKKVLTFIFALSCLYAKAQLSTTVSGVVWVDQAPVNGLRDPNETKLPGILVELYDASTNKVVSSAISGTDGSFTLNTTGGTYFIQYVFPTDGFEYAAFRSGNDNALNSAADPSTELSESFTIASGSTTNFYGLGLKAKENTRTFCDGKELTVTNWDKTFALPKSNLEVSKLLNVKLFSATAVYHPTIGIENTNVTAITPTVEYKGRVTLTVPNTNGLGVFDDMTESFLSKKIPLEGYDGVSDYTGTSGKSFVNEFSSGSKVLEYRSLGGRNVFTGSGDILIPGTTTSVSSIIGAANIQFVVSTDAAAGVCVVYTYQSGALPVTLVSFTAKKSDSKTTKLEWATTSETMSDHFEIQKSNNGKQWSKIGVVKSSGDSKKLAEYSSEDLFPRNGQNLYRLKMVDRDGSFTFSRIVSATFDGIPSLLNTYPNPAISQVSVRAEGNEKITDIHIFDQSGKRVNVVLLSDEIDVSTLSNGIYSIRATYESGAVDTKKIVVLR